MLKDGSHAVSWQHVKTSKHVRNFILVLMQAPDNMLKNQIMLPNIILFSCRRLTTCLSTSPSLPPSFILSFPSPSSFSCIWGDYTSIFFHWCHLLLWYHTEFFVNFPLYFGIKMTGLISNIKTIYPKFCIGFKIRKSRSEQLLLSGSGHSKWFSSAALQGVMWDWVEQ